MKKYVFLLLTISLCIGCKKENSVIDIDKLCFINSFSIIGEDHSTYSLDIDFNKGEIKNDKPIPLSVDISNALISFNTEEEIEVKDINNNLLISGESKLNLIFPTVIGIFYKNEKIYEYKISLTKEVDPNFSLLNITGFDSNGTNIPLYINDENIYNRFLLEKQINLSSIVIKYEANMYGSLYYNNTRLDNGETKLDCTSTNKLQLISPDGQIKEYNLNLYNSIPQSNNVEYFENETMHIYEGGGLTFNLYHGQIFSMNKDNQDKFYKLLFENLDMKYILYNYKKRPTDIKENLEMFDTFLDNAKKYNNDLNVVALLGAYFPEEMKTTKKINGEELSILNIEKENIYDELSEYEYQILNDMHERGHDVNILSVCNEPDWEKKWLWGYEDSKIGIKELIKKSIPPLLEKIGENGSFNKPQIMVPATISPKSCFEYINIFKSDNEVWELVDIINTHQYVNGCDKNAFQNIKNNLDGKLFIQSEQHVNKGDNLGLSGYDREQKAIASLIAMFEVAVNNGASSWCYFVSNVPDEDSDVGLMQIAWEGEPKPYKQYYAYKQLHTFYGNKANVIKTATTNNNLRIVGFKSIDNNKIIINIGNISKDKILINQRIIENAEKISIYETSKRKNMECIEDIKYKGNSKLLLELNPFSLYSIVITCND